ncbi:MAG: methyltransferase protein, partial [Solirubrobacterales bacterium]|nr:methyltransferase protein [Solirubrobacterales bacterium]
MSWPAQSGVDGVAPTDPRSASKREALELFRGLPRHYDALSAALSFWQDPRWRRALVSAVAPRSGERVLDVATGTGMVA